MTTYIVIVTGNLPATLQRVTTFCTLIDPFQMLLCYQRLRFSGKWIFFYTKKYSSYPVFVLLLIMSIRTSKTLFNPPSLSSATVTSPKPTPVHSAFLSFHTPCTQGYTQYSCYSSFLTLAKERQQNRYIVLLVVTHSTRHIVLNWCISAERIQLKNYVLVALDSASFQLFSNLSAPVVQIPRAASVTSRSGVWIRRTYFIYVLLCNDFHVLVSDADAIAVRSPFLELFSNSSNHGFDIIASPSNFPNPLRRELPDECNAFSRTQWRYQPCMGWIFIRSSTNMKNFFSQLFIPFVLKYADDQIGLACALRFAQESWHGNYSWSPIESTVMHFRSPSLSMLMLPAARYVRNCTQFREDKVKNYGIFKFELKKVVLFHCKGKDKKMNAENNGVWYLGENWSELTASKSLPFDVYLEKITRKTDINDMYAKPANALTL